MKIGKWAPIFTWIVGVAGMLLCLYLFNSKSLGRFILVMLGSSVFFWLAHKITKRARGKWKWLIVGSVMTVYLLCAVGFYGLIYGWWLGSPAAALPPFFDGEIKSYQAILRVESFDPVRVSVQESAEAFIDEYTLRNVQGMIGRDDRVSVGIDESGMIRSLEIQKPARPNQQTNIIVCFSAQGSQTDDESCLDSKFSQVEDNFYGLFSENMDRMESVHFLRETDFQEGDSTRMVDDLGALLGEISFYGFIFWHERGG